MNDMLNTEWDKLTIQLKHLIIQQYVAKGITNLKDIKDMYNVHCNGGNLFGRGGIETLRNNTITKEKELPEVIITPDNDYNVFLNSLPDNLKNTDEKDYRLKRYWELNGRPKDFRQGVSEHIFSKQPDGYHASSVALNQETGNYEFMKYPNHPTIGMELDWYNSNDPEAVEFRKNYYLDKTSKPYYQYIRKDNGGSIHIKPENRGKFTALKERTGHSTSWFIENGTPALKKMAVFANNARKWNHADGGSLQLKSAWDTMIDSHGRNAFEKYRTAISGNIFAGGGPEQLTQYTDEGYPYVVDPSAYQKTLDTPQFHWGDVKDYKGLDSIPVTSDEGYLTDYIKPVGVNPKTGNVITENGKEYELIKDLDGITVTGHQPVFNKVSQEILRGMQYWKEHPDEFVDTAKDVGRTSANALALSGVPAFMALAGVVNYASDDGVKKTVSLSNQIDEKLRNGASVNDPEVLDLYMQYYKSMAGDALDLSMLIPGIGQAYQYGKKSYSQAKDAVKDIYNGMGYYGDNAISRVYNTMGRRYNLPTKPQMPEFMRTIRQTSNGPEQLVYDENGNLFISNPTAREGHEGLTNFTTDQPVAAHSRGNWDNGSVVVVNPKAVNTEALASIEPSDTYLLGDRIAVNPKDATVYTGNPDIIAQAKQGGTPVVTSPELQRHYARMLEQMDTEGTELKTVSMENTSAAQDYRNAIQQMLNKRGRPTQLDYSLLEQQTGLKSGIMPNEQSREGLLDYTRRYFENPEVYENDPAYYYPNGDWYDITSNNSIEPLQNANYKNVFYDPATKSEDYFRDFAAYAKEKGATDDLIISAWKNVNASNPGAYDGLTFDYILSQADNGASSGVNLSLMDKFRSLFLNSENAEAVQQAALETVFDPLKTLAEALQLRNNPDKILDIYKQRSGYDASTVKSDADILSNGKTVKDTYIDEQIQLMQNKFPFLSREQAILKVEQDLNAHGLSIQDIRDASGINVEFDLPENQLYNGAYVDSSGPKYDVYQTKTHENAHDTRGHATLNSSKETNGYEAEGFRMPANNEELYYNNKEKSAFGTEFMNLLGKTEHNLTKEEVQFLKDNRRILRNYGLITGVQEVVLDMITDAGKAAKWWNEHSNVVIPGVAGAAGATAVAKSNDVK